MQPKLSLLYYFRQRLVVYILAAKAATTKKRQFGLHPEKATCKDFLQVQIEGKRQRLREKFNIIVTD